MSPDARTHHQASIEVSASEIATNMALAWYLTALSNDPVFRQVPPWKDFVRVRTVDLESASFKHAIRPVTPELSVPIDRESQGELSTENNPPVNISYEYPPHQSQEHSSRAAHTRESVLPEVQVSNFKMVCVLGIGSRGKLLLALHKSSSAPCVLKVMAKRRVLAHREIQRTLTEQAVLRRMADEGTNPFVIKLWRSFHDEDNLYLVMVSLAPMYMRPLLMIVHVAPGLPPGW